MRSSLPHVLLERDGMTGIEADQDIKEKRVRVFNGENPESILFHEYRLEPDYIWELID